MTGPLTVGEVVAIRAVVRGGNPTPLRETRHNENGPNECYQHPPGLTRSLDLRKEGLMPKRTCSVDGCTKFVNARGLCGTHYSRMRRRGSLETTTKSLPPEQRFWTRVDKSSPDGCWNWTGAKSSGYGSFQAKGTHPAHRYAYQLLVGPIPEGLILDHKCRNRSCVNPDHLHPVTYQQNAENLSRYLSKGKSGIRGVFRRGARWRVKVTVRGMAHYGGYFDDIDEAEAAAIALRNRVMTNNLDDPETHGPSDSRDRLAQRLTEQLPRFVTHHVPCTDGCTEPELCDQCPCHQEET